MGYYLRVFSTIDQSPTIQEMIQAITKEHIPCFLDSITAKKELSNPDWKQATLFYNKKKKPFILDRDVNTDLVKEEVKEFLQLLGSAGASLKKRKVIKHLKNTKQLFALRVPTTDITGDTWPGWQLSDAITAYLQHHTDGMIQADSEGFYIAGKLVVKTP